MSTLSTLNFPVIRGIQAGREYYVAMWTLRMMGQISVFDEKDLPPELRAQRVLNKGRIPEMAHYILDNPNDYVFSAITASIDSEVAFEPLSPSEKRLGILKVPMEAKFIINDGQHRRAAILSALEQKPELGYETIAVVFFLDIGLERSQQMFADLNRYAIRPSDLVDGIATGNPEEDATTARNYWEAVAQHFPVWLNVRDGKMPASEVREGFIHSHGIALQALGKAGNALLKTWPSKWKSKLAALEKINWSRSNAKIWEGRALIGGKVSKVTSNVTLTTNVVKKALDLPLNAEEQRVEDAHNKRN